MIGQQASGQHRSAGGLRAGVALAMALAALPAFAQQQDPGINVARTVNPRIAYRGIPLEDNPIRVRATTFPSQIFHGTLNDSLGFLTDDAELGSNELGSNTGSVGLAMDATRALLAPASDTRLLNGPAMGGGAPLGMGGSVGGAIGNATQGLAGTITSAVLGAVQAAPAAGP